VQLLVRSAKQSAIVACGAFESGECHAVCSRHAQAAKKWVAGSTDVGVKAIVSHRNFKTSLVFDTVTNLEIHGIFAIGTEPIGMFSDAHFIWQLNGC
jgi:hypothetical protein